MLRDKSEAMMDIELWGKRSNWLVSNGSEESVKEDGGMENFI